MEPLSFSRIVCGSKSKTSWLENFAQFNSFLSGLRKNLENHETTGDRVLFYKEKRYGEYLHCEVVLSKPQIFWEQKLDSQRKFFIDLITWYKWFSLWFVKREEFEDVCPTVVHCCLCHSLCVVCACICCCICILEKSQLKFIENWIRQQQKAKKNW